MKYQRITDLMLLWPLLPHLANGATNADIGEALWLSEEAVKSRIAALLPLMGARNRTHAVSLAHRTGLLTAEGELSPTAKLAATHVGEAA